MTMEAKGWPGRKFYLSNEAFALLKAHCEGTPLTMSAYLDGLIKAQLDSAAERFLREQPSAKVTHSGSEEAREMAETIADALSKITGVDPIKAVEVPTTATGRLTRLTPEPQEIKKQPAKKDFKIDL